MPSGRISTLAAFLALVPMLAAKEVRAEAPCEREDAALGELAEELSKRRLRGEGLPSPDETVRTLRDGGAVFPSLRWLVLTSAEGQSATAFLGHVQKRARESSRGLRAPRAACGVAISGDERGRRVAVVVVAPEHAQVDPVPAHVRLGSWITVRARFHAAMPGARVVVLGPRGAPRTVPSSLSGGELVARFSADQNGLFSAQIVGETPDGPLPLAELSTRVGGGAASEDSAPGELVLAQDRPSTVRAMLRAARASEGRAELLPEVALDRLAQAHAVELARRGHIAHDAGHGNPAERVMAAGVEASEVGENVAHAASIEACHRALWRSASHRENVLSSRFRAVGVGVAEASDGTVFVVQLFRG